MIITVSGMFSVCKGEALQAGTSAFSAPRPHDELLRCPAVNCFQSLPQEELLGSSHLVLCEVASAPSGLPSTMQLLCCSGRVLGLKHWTAAYRIQKMHSSEKEQLETKSEAKYQKRICQVVFEHFEEQYSKELGEAWSPVWKVLTTPHFWQYAVLLNKFSFYSEVENELRLKGYRLLFPDTSCFRQSLKCYIASAPGRFPVQKHRAGKLKDYYLLNAASVLAVLALELESGEKVLDMCAAPGGKSIAMLQHAWPGRLYANEYDNLRSNWLKQTLESFIPESLMNLVSVSQLDGRQIGNLQPEAFDKVLVNAPCSHDRSWLFSSDLQQASLLLAQRKALSAAQIQLLRSAIKALRPGGTLVYSTCTLSKAENSDVITHILNLCSSVEPVDISILATSASQEFTLASGVQQHELLVLPEKGKAWGPIYISKLKKM